MEHDRYIITKDRMIIIGVGLDFMKESQGELVVRKATNFTYKKINPKMNDGKLEEWLSGRIV